MVLWHCVSLRSQRSGRILTDKQSFKNVRWGRLTCVFWGRNGIKVCAFVTSGQYINGPYHRTNQPIRSSAQPQRWADLQHLVYQHHHMYWLQYLSRRLQYFSRKIRTINEPVQLGLSAQVSRLFNLSPFYVVYDITLLYCCPPRHMFRTARYRPTILKLDTRLHALTRRISADLTNFYCEA